jgi:predicted nucleic acid-binding protein
VAKKDQFVADSSVVAKWFLTETGSDKATELRDEFASGRLKLAVPSLLFYEVLNALRFSGSFSSPDLLVAAESLSKYRFDIWRPRGRLLQLSAELSMKEDLSVYDACYVALAQRTYSKLVTEDRELLNKFPSQTLAMSEFRKRTARIS